MEEEYKRQRAEISGLKSQLKNIAMGHEEDRKRIKAVHRSRRETWAQEKAALQSRLQELKHQLSAERSSTEQAELGRAEVDAERKQWMATATRYKRKVRSLSTRTDVEVVG